MGITKVTPLKSILVPGVLFFFTFTKKKYNTTCLFCALALSKRTFFND